MKILIVSFYYPPEMGAAPSRISNMAEGLRREGAEVDVLTCLPNYPKGQIFEGYRGCFSKHETINGVDIYRYWTYASVSKNPLFRILGMMGFSLTMWLFGMKMRKVRGYDRVIIQSPPLMVGFSAMLLFRCLYHRKTVLNVSDLWPISAVELGAVKKDGIYYRVLAAMERFVYRHATAYQGQSQEIIDHVEEFGFGKPHFLYRNLQPRDAGESLAGVQPLAASADRSSLKLVYAGLLGVAQDILGMIQHINFKQLGAELHIYGGGNQTEAIEEYVKEHDCGVVCHGFQSKEYISSILSSFHASIVPLAVSIKGAVPSKIFDLLPHGTPILFCGGGEGERIVASHGFGMTSRPGDYDSLSENITRLKALSNDEYLELRNRCLEASTHEFSFDMQMQNYYKFLNSNF